MLQQAITVACNDADGKINSLKIPEFFSCHPNKHSPHKLEYLGVVSLFTAQSSDQVIAFKLHSFVVYIFDEKKGYTNIKALVTESHLYGSSAPERVLQILQLLQAEMVRTSMIHVEMVDNFSKDNLLAFQYLGFTSPTMITHKSSSMPRVILNRNAVLQLTHFTNRILWGKFGYFLSFPGEFTSKVHE